MAKAKEGPERMDATLKVAWKTYTNADAAAKRTRALALEARQKLRDATVQLHEQVGDVTGLPLDTPLFEDGKKGKGDE